LISRKMPQFSVWAWHLVGIFSSGRRKARRSKNGKGKGKGKGTKFARRFLRTRESCCQQLNFHRCHQEANLWSEKGSKFWRKMDRRNFTSRLNWKRPLVTEYTFFWIPFEFSSAYHGASSSHHHKMPARVSNAFTCAIFVGIVKWTHQTHKPLTFFSVFILVDEFNELAWQKVHS
jgi:hypothetical protein